MDSSSDSEEFYECDDDVEVENTVTKKEIIDDKRKDGIPTVQPTKNAGKSEPSQTKQERRCKTGNHEDNDQKTKESQEYNNNPRFGVPPTRETCWLPEVTPKIGLGESEIHPAHHELLNETPETQTVTEHVKVATSELDSVSEDQNISCNLGNNNPDLKKDPEQVLQIADISKEVIDKSLGALKPPSSHMWDGNDNWKNLEREIKEKCKSSEDTKITDISDDNQWDNDDWVDKNQLKPKETLQISKTEKPEIQNSKPSEEENLWDDDDDWGKLAAEPKPDPAEDLWGDGDGWGIDTPVATPAKSPNTEHSSPKSNVQSNSDLWAEGDNWEIDNNLEQSQPLQEQSPFEALASQDSSWGGWSNWGISSVLSTAANITTSVSQGLTTVLETGIGVPDPEDLARRHKAEENLRKQLPESKNQEDEPHSDQSDDKGQIPFNLGIGNWVSGVSTITKLVETTGSKVITSGLGTLETIGKKTYEVLQENDPQLKRKRAFLKKLEGNKPVLSQILREAKERAEGENKERERRHFAKKANYETMFDDYQGLVHLEALEMLSKQCDIKLETIMAQTKELAELQETMEQIKDLCELNTEEDEDENGNFEQLREKINTAVEDINIGISCDKLLETFVEITSQIDSFTSHNPAEMHSISIENLAKITALAVEQYHKAGELLLVKEHRSTADEADSLVQLTTAISTLITILSTKYSEKLKELAIESTNAEIKSFISNIYLEAANSSRYIEDAFSLLIPVIQVGAV